MSAKNKKLKAASKEAAKQEHSLFQQQDFDECFVVGSQSEHYCFLIKEFEKLIREINDPYLDNFRWCVVGNSEQEKNYNESQNRGCCGFADKVVFNKQNKSQYKIGFNYGH